MHTEEEWVRLICENPYDMHLRLIYADWLDEQELHHFQAQCIRADMGMSSDLLTQTGQLLLGGFNYRHYGIQKWEGRAGFVSKVELPCSAFMEHAESIFRAQPVTEVVLTDKSYLMDIDGLRDWGFPEEWKFDDHIREGSGDRHILPIELFALFECRKHFTRAGMVLAAVHCDKNDAYPALSRACVEWGRKRAGLPSLSPLLH